MRDTYLQAAQCPPSLKPQEFGLWRIERRTADNTLVKAEVFRRICGRDYQTALCRFTEATMHLCGEIVMDDSFIELRRHLPIWLAAKGRVLVTGLGLGCVIRGLLVSPDVSHIDVIEIDRQIIERVGVEFAGNPRVAVHHGNALTCKMPGKHWNFAWHDIYTEDGSLQLLHAKLIARYRNRCARQGAWMLPRFIKRRWADWGLVG